MSLDQCREIATLWNEQQGPEYTVRDADLVWNLTQQNYVRYDIAEVEGVRFIYATITSEGAAAGLSARSLWLSLWCEVASGREAAFIAGLLKFAKSKSKTRVVLGGDDFHFVSGVPLHLESGKRLSEAMRAAGFIGDRVADFVGDVTSPAVRTYIEEGSAISRANHWSFSAVESRGERAELREFLSQSFAGRWTREFEFWSSREDTGRAYWSAFKNKEGATFGFARMAIRGRVKGADKGWVPGALRLRLGDGLLVNDCCLGPIGVAAESRGQGAGRALLAQVLDSLLIHNAGRICVDWTNAFKYYYPLKFEEQRHYWAGAYSQAP